MMARLLTVLAVALPLGACAAQPGGRADGAAGMQAQQQAAMPAAADAQAAAAGTHAAANTAAGAAPANTVQAPLGSTPMQDAPASPGALSSATGSATAGTAPAERGPTERGPVALPPPVQPMQSGPATGSLLQTLFALIAVLAVLGALAWFLKRYGPKAGGGTASLRVVGSLNLGGRERLLVVEVGDQWIVVGASPGRVNALATMPRQQADAHPVETEGATLAPHLPAANSFADWLKQTIDKRK